MKFKELTDKIEYFAPLSLQEEWDNSGIQIKAKDEVQKVLVALEITNEVIDEAIESGCDAIVTHHPMFFDPVKTIDMDTIKGGYISKLLSNQISVYSSHTPFDIFEGGNNDYFGEVLGFDVIEKMPGDALEICRMSKVSELEQHWNDASMKFKDFVKHAAKKLKLSERFFAFCGDLESDISTIGWCTGAGSEYLELAKSVGCDLFITGDFKYHQAILAKEIGINVLDCGHYGTEYIFVENMARRLSSVCDCEIIRSRVDINPFTVGE